MKKTVLLGFFLTLSMILSYIESVLPLSIGIPGIKLGLPNMAVVVLLYMYGAGEALTVNLLRIVLSGFLFGNLFSIIYSVSGALFGFAIMFFMKKIHYFSIAGVSIGGGVFHNIGQLLIAVLLTRSQAPLYYMPILIVAGAVTGFIIGLVSVRVLPYMEHVLKQ